MGCVRAKNIPIILLKALKTHTRNAKKTNIHELGRAYTFNYCEPGLLSNILK
jgi:hypothetical protein